MQLQDMKTTIENKSTDIYMKFEKYNILYISQKKKSYFRNEVSTVIKIIALDRFSEHGEYRTGCILGALFGRRWCDEPL